MQSIRDRRLILERQRYPLLEIPSGDWGDVLSVTVPAYGLRFEVDHTYPFRHPTAFYKGEDVVGTLKLKYITVVELLRPYNVDFPCICCRIILSPTQWNPTHTLESAVADLLEWSDALDDVTRYFAFKNRLPFDDLVLHKILQFLIKPK
jgi:hypothetical protein